MEKLKGFCIFPPANDIKTFVFSDEALADFYPYPLAGGVIVPPNEKREELLNVDWVGTDEQWPGYIKGFLYKDGKFLGKIHYVPESNLPVENLNGEFKLLENGIEIKGIWYDANESKQGFYIRITRQELSSKLINPKSKESKSTNLKLEKKSNSYLNVLSKELLDLISNKSAVIKRKDKKQVLDQYNQILQLKLQPNSTEQLMLAASVAYSWMPTMLDLYGTDKSLSKELNAVRLIGSINNSALLESKENEIETNLIILSRFINHSTVGASKTLHIFFPEFIPIIDSNVLKGWNKIFVKHYKKYPELRLPKNIPQTIERQVKVYQKYWKLLAYWGDNIGSNNLRLIEEHFYLIGRGISKVKK